MLKPAVTVSLLLVASTAVADTTTTEADTLVVVTPNAPVVITQGAAPQVVDVEVPSAAPGAAPVVAASAVMPAAPQNEAWSNVSHINGVPVKVGERQDYLLKPKKGNLALNPFGLFFGYYDFAGSLALGKNLAASFAITGWSFDGGSESGYQISATLPLYFRKTFSGPFLEGGLLIRGSQEEEYYPHASECFDCSSWSSDDDAWVGPQLLFGWHWTFDSGLNTSFAFGVAKRLGGSDSDTSGNAYWRVGYAF